MIRRTGGKFDCDRSSIVYGDRLELKTPDRLLRRGADWQRMMNDEQQTMRMASRSVTNLDQMPV
jgi:hypothetical protein